MSTNGAPLVELHEAIACLGRLTAAFQRRRMALAAGVGLTDHQWGVLEEISTEHFMPSLFARQSESSPAAVSKTLRQLLDKGLVSVSLSKHDGRQREYVLTLRGKRTMATLREERERAITEIWQTLDAGDVRAFIRFAGELLTRLDRFTNQQQEA